MEQFNLEEWLKDKSRKVVTRDGRPVRIVCWDLPGEYKIIGITDETDDGYTVINKKTEGTDGVSTNDLFFADEEELTEFEKCVQNILNEPHFQDVQAVKQFSKTLIDLARKEMMKDAVEGEIVYQIGNSVIAPTDIRYKVMSDRVYIPNVKLGDKVKIIIVKEEQQ